MTHASVPRVMFPPDQEPLNWSPMWRPVMPQSSAMSLLQPSPAPQVRQHYAPHQFHTILKVIGAHVAL